MLAGTEYDTPLGQIVRSELDGNLVASKNSDVVLAHFAWNVGHYNMTVVKFNAKGGVRQSLNYCSLHFNAIFFCHKILNIDRFPEQNPTFTPAFCPKSDASRLRCASVCCQSGLISSLSPTGNIAAISVHTLQTGHFTIIIGICKYRIEISPWF